MKTEKNVGITYVGNTSEREIEGTIQEVKILMGNTIAHFNKVSNLIAAFDEKDRELFILGQKRQEALQLFASDVEQLESLLVTVLENYRDMDAIVKSLKKQDLNMHLSASIEDGVGGQVGALNTLLGEVNNYAFALGDLLADEEKELQQYESQGKEVLEDNKLFDKRCALLIEKRRIINQYIEARTMSVAGLLQMLRKETAKLRVLSLEDEVKARSERLRSQQQQMEIEDIRDYDDLEGQYSQTFDDETSDNEGEAGETGIVK